MIYESAVALRPDLGDKALESIKKILEEVVSTASGEVLFSDDWGVRSFYKNLSQANKAPEKRHYVYFIYKGTGNVMGELQRRFKINESVLNFLNLKMGPDKEQEKLLKEYQSPFGR